MIQPEYGLAENTTGVAEEDTADFDATKQEENPSNTAEIEGDMNNDLEEEDVPPIVPGDSQLPNNDFCFTEDDFMESVTGINNITRHRGI